MPTETDMETPNRRHEDRDREIRERLAALERQYEQLRVGYVSLENAVGAVKVEQTHTREIVDARLRVIEEQSKTHILKLDELRGLMSEAGQSPMGRALQQDLRDLQQESRLCDEKLEKKVDAHAIQLAELERAREQVKGGLTVTRWWAAAAGAVLGLLQIIELLRTAKGLP